MEIFVDTTDASEGKKYKDIIVRTVEEIVKSEGFNNAAVDVMLTTNDGIKELNLQYRKINKETDCLSFPQYEKNELDLLNKNVIAENDGGILLGDVVISFEKAVSQAEEFGHSLERELAFLAAHSALHLLGYDHENPEDEKEMFEKQEKTLINLNYLR